MNFRLLFAHWCRKKATVFLGPGSCSLALTCCKIRHRAVQWMLRELAERLMWLRPCCSVRQGLLRKLS